MTDQSDPPFPAELVLRDGFLSGAEVVLDGDAASRTVRGKFLADLLTSASARKGEHRLLKLSGAHVLGDIDLEGAVVGLMVALTSCLIDGDICLDEAETRSIRLTGTSLRRLRATNLVVRGTVEMNEGFDAREKVTLTGAHITGDLRLAEARFHCCPEEADGDSVKGVALLASRTRVDGSVLARGMEVDGQARMIGVRVGGLFSLRAAKLRNPRGVALQCERAEIGESLFFQRGFESTGSIVLQNALIKGGVDGLGSHFAAPDGTKTALNLRRVYVGRNVALSDATIQGGMNLRGGQVGGSVVLRNARFEGDHADLDLSRATVAGVDLRWRAGPRKADLTFARLNLIEDDAETWPQEISLTGCSYQMLRSDQPIALEERLDWLGRDPDHYQPHPYDELARAYRAMGEDEHANEVALQKQRQRRATLAPPARLVGYAQDLFVGYGYRNSRAVLWLVSLLCVGGIVFQRHPPAPLQDPPPFNSWIFTLDLLLPVLQLGQADAYTVVGRLRFLAWFLVVLGWALAAALVAGLTRLVNRS